MYQFCFNNNLQYVWAYLWINWYQKGMWNLWARLSAVEICIFRTTMLTESHWKVLKRDYLPKFFRPRLDLVIYIIISRLIPHHQQQYNKYIIKWKGIMVKRFQKRMDYIGKERHQRKLYSKYRKMDMQLPFFFTKSVLFM